MRANTYLARNVLSSCKTLFHALRNRRDYAPNNAMLEAENESLFRRQALRALAARPLGIVAWRPPKTWARMTAILVTLFLLGGALAYRAEFTYKASARGWLVAKQGDVQLRHRTTASVVAVLVATGEKVTVGDELLHLSSEVSLTEGRGEAAMALQHIDAIEQELALQLSLSEGKAGREQRRLEAELVAAERQLENVSLQTQQLNQQVAGSFDKLARLQQLFATGAIAEWDLIQQRERMEALQLQQLRQQREQQEYQQIVVSMQSEMQQLPASLALRHSELRMQQARLKKERGDRESQQITVLRSPIAGRIAALNTRQGQTITASQTLLTVLPEDTELVAEVFVPSRAAGFIAKGQSVTLNLDAYPQRRFGSFRGEVSEVSDAAYLPRDIPPTFSIAEAAFRVRIQLQGLPSLPAKNRPRLRPGMLLRANVILDSQSLLSRLLDPLHSVWPARR